MPDKIQNMQHRISCSYLTVMLIALLGVSAPVLSNTPARVALIADKAFDLYKSPLVSLVEVKLSQKEGIELLERAEIDKLLQEQQLSVAGLLQRHNAVKVGGFLRVDAFLLLSTEADKDQKQNSDKLLRVRLVETAHGLRLLDSFEEHGSAKLEDTVKRITEKVIAAAPKIMLPPGEAIPVGIVDIHRVQLSERYQWLARALPAMLSGRLSKELRIIMLEREDLKILHDEKLLTEGKDAEFWNSAVLIDGYLQRGGTNEDIEMKLGLRRATGKVISAFTVPVESNEPLEAIDKAANKVIPKLLNVPPSVSWQPKQEAQEFFRQGQLLKNHERHKDAIKLLETAHALQPENVFYTGALFENEWQVRFVRENSSRIKETGISYYSDLELAEMVSLLVRQIRDEYEKGSLRALYVLEQWGKPLGLGTFEWGYFLRPVSVSTEEIMFINRDNRKIFAKTIKRALKDNLYKYKWRWEGMIIDLAWSSSDNPDELIKNLRETFTQFIMPPDMGGNDQSFGKRFSLCRSALLFPAIRAVTAKQIEKTQLKGTGERFQKLWVQYLEDLTKIEDPLLNFIGYMALAFQYQGGSTEAKNCCRSALNILLEEIKSPNEPMIDGYKKLLRNKMKSCIRHSGFEKSEQVSIFEKIYEPLIEKKNAHNLALWNPCFHFSFYHLSNTPKTAIRCIKLLERIAMVLQNCKSSEDIGRALSLIKDCLAKIKDKYPELVTVTKPGNFTVTMLLGKEDWPQKNTFQFTKVLLKNDMLWVGFAEPGLGLTGINLPEKKLASLQQTDCGRGTVIYANCKARKISGSITGIAVHEEKSYISVRDIGMVEFPGSLVSGREFLETPKILTEEDGLPSVSITGMAEVGNKLWLAYGGREKESGLIIYEPKSGDWETVFCSSLKGDNPFDAGETYAISSLTPGPENKLFFLVGEREYDPTINYQMIQWWGLWKIDTNTRELKYIWHDDQFPLVLESIDDFGESWWLRDLYSLTLFDPSLEKAKFVIGRRRILRPTKPMPELQIDLFVPEFSPGELKYGFMSSGYIELRTAAVHKDKMWARLGKSQLIIIHRGKGFEEAEIIYNNILNGDKVLRFFSTPYGLIAIGEGTVGLIESGGKKE